MSKSRLENTDIPGNSVGSHAAYLRQMVRQAEALASFEDLVQRLDEAGTFVQGLSIRFPQDDSPEYLAVVRVNGASGRQVGFHSAPTLLETLVGLTNRLRNGKLKFREDEYEQGS